IVAKPVTKKPALKELLARVTPDNVHEETDWKAERQGSLVKRGYVPDSGDLVWASFDPQSGHEQAGRRPALVISSHSYNEKVGLALACPITSKVKGYPFEVEANSTRVRGVV